MLRDVFVERVSLQLTLNTYTPFDQKSMAIDDEISFKRSSYILTFHKARDVSFMFSKKMERRRLPVYNNKNVKQHNYYNLYS